MAAIASGLNFSTLSAEGFALNICSTINTTANPEYPATPVAFGTPTLGMDGSEWVYAKPAANYAIGTVGYLDTLWNFTALTTTNASGISGVKVGVMSQVASVTASPTSTNYDGVWVQLDGLCPAIQGAASTAANAQLYTSATAGQITSTSGGNVAINGIILTTAVGSGGAATAVGLLNKPELALTT
jgi:hypothetical protein